jgi:hypothetical protein
MVKYLKFLKSLKPFKHSDSPIISSLAFPKISFSHLSLSNSYKNNSEKASSYDINDNNNPGLFDKSNFHFITILI